jgi:hypothetical protein
MKKKIIIPMLVLFVAQAFGQSGWPPVGAKWFYSYRPCSIWGCDSRVKEFIYFEAVNDTVINDTLCTKIIVEYHTEKNEVKYLGDEYIFSTENQVYNYHHGHFYLLYDFSVQVGDTIELSLGSNCNFYEQLELDSLYFFEPSKGKHVVEEKDSIAINDIKYLSMQLKQISVSGISNGVLNFGTKPIIKSIGSLDFLFGKLLTGIESGFYGPLRCYSDSFVNYTTDVPCDLLSSVEIVKSNPKVWVYPNPITSNSIVFFPNKKNDNAVLEILDSGGKIIYSVETCEDHIPIGAVNLSKGVFFYRIFSGIEVIGTGRFLKN